MSSKDKSRSLSRYVVPTTFAIMVGMASASAYADVRLSATASDGKITLSWTTTDNLRAVQVMRDTDANPAGRGRIATLPSNVRSFTDSGVTNGRQYWYWVKHTDINGVSGNSNGVSGTAGATPSPEPNPGNDPIAGYSPCSSEGKACTFTGTVDIAYGANGKFKFLRNQSGGSVSCSNATFGDPIYGTVKACYVKQVSTQAINYTMDLAISGNGKTSPSAGSHSYKSGTAVKITATPDTGYEFAGWSGAFTGNTNPLTVTLNGNKTLTAMFTKISAPPPVSDGSCPDEMVGFATVHADGVDGTTGGGDATPTRVTTLADLKAAAQDGKPRVIMVSGTIDTGSSALSIASNKTIIGADKNATIKGGLDMRNVSNIIIRNLNIQGKRSGSSPADTIASRNSHHIWYDHLNIWDAGDGLLDITIESNYQTVSWSKFWYSNANDDHRLASLNGSGGGSQPKDYGKMKTTYHHNWWGSLVDQRMPRLMYGQGHNFNNFFNSPGNSYCIGVGSYGSVLIENNYFKDVRNPHQFMYNVYMYSAANGNIYDNTSGTRDTGHGGSEHVSGQESYRAEPFTPPYKYTLDAAKDVPDLVKRCAGPQ